MFSLVQNITSALKPLETEAVDARLGKKPKKSTTTSDDLDDEVAKTHENHDDLREEQTDDYSILSIKSIILFLEDFLELRLSSVLSDREHKGEQLSFAPWFSKRQSNDSGTSVRSKNAIKAYAHAAETSGRAVYYKPQQQDDVKEKQASQIQVKSLYSLIRDLRKLQQRGTGYLKINTQKTFLDGIYLAVNLEKSKLD
ncbi:MAG: hypothetical protein COA45_06330 [Zetaproteobacteria bacterium]|nr:MAG: hypothetical protein COA45_06330 [Zetaproteobacteria bacterium]